MSDVRLDLDATIRHMEHEARSLAHSLKTVLSALDHLRAQRDTNHHDDQPVPLRLVQQGGQ